MNYPNEEDLIKNNSQITQKISNKYIKSMNYPQNTINKGKIILKKQKIKENINPEIIEFKLKEDFYLNMPRPIQNLEPYQTKEKIKKNQLFENIETNHEYPMPKHSIKSSNSFKINTKINNKKYMNKNKINELDNNDILYKNYSNNNISKNNFNILGQNSGKITQKKITNFNMNNPSNNNSELQMTNSSIQISGKNFQKKNSYSKTNNNYDALLYPISLKSDKNNNININKTKVKKEYNKIKSDNLIQELKTNKINKIKNEDSMDLDIFSENNFMKTNNEYNNIFFYNSKGKVNNNTNDINENLPRYKVNNNNNNKKISSAKENAKNKFIYKKIKNLNNKKEEQKKPGIIIIKEKRIKNNLKNNFNIIDFIIKLQFKEEKISININNDTDNIIKEKIENIINNNGLNNTYLEPIFSLVNNSINVLKNVNTLKIMKIKKFNKINPEDLNDELNYSFILDLYEKNRYDEFFEDFDEIYENEKLLNMTI